MLTLAQFGRRAVESLADPPLVSTLLFERPFPALVVVGAAGLIAALVLNARARLRIGLVCAAVAALVCLGLVVSAGLVTTAREQIRERSHALAEAVAVADLLELDQMLGERARLVHGQRHFDRAEILQRVRSTLGGPYAVEDHRVLETQIEMRGPRVGRSQLRVRVIPEATRVPVFAWIGVGWAEYAAEWKVTEIDVLWISGE